MEKLCDSFFMTKMQRYSRGYGGASRVCPGMRSSCNPANLSHAAGVCELMKAPSDWKYAFIFEFTALTFFLCHAPVRAREALLRSELQPACGSFIGVGQAKK